MKVNYGRDFTPEELQQISGRTRLATRKEVKAWLDALIARAVSSQVSLTPTVAMNELHDSMGKTCSNLDHIYPARQFAPERGTPCYCGKRTWGNKERSE